MSRKHPRGKGLETLLIKNDSPQVTSLSGHLNLTWANSLHNFLFIIKPNFRSISLITITFHYFNKLHLENNFPNPLAMPIHHLFWKPREVRHHLNFSTITSFVNISTTTMMTLFPSDLGKPVIKSIEISSQRWLGMDKGCRSPGVLILSTLFC